MIQIISSFSFLWLWSAFQGTKQRVMLITFKSELFKVAVEERIEREELKRQGRIYIHSVAEEDFWWETGGRLFQWQKRLVLTAILYI